MAVTKHNLDHVDILIADSDAGMTKVLSQNLKAMGMKRIHHVKNGQAALDFIRDNHVDVLITEWNMYPMDGISLVNYIRRNPNTPNRLLPIIMLTGKGELSDVEQARDYGITEFVVKPFSARSLFLRIEQLVDHPRGFVAAPGFVGPDRRRRNAPVKESRRKVSPRERAANQLTVGVPEHAEIVAPMFTLKQAIGITGPISTIITPGMVEAAQKSIEAMKDESLQWLKEDLARLEEGLRQARVRATPESVERMKDASMSVKSRGGMFSRELASKIARLLYLFLSNKYVANVPLYNTVVEKHIDALKVAVMVGDGNTALAKEVLGQLEKLAER